jgi:hypothetical protein
MAVTSQPRRVRLAEDPALEVAVLQLARAVSGLIHAVGRLADKQKLKDATEEERRESAAIVEVLLRAQGDLDKAIETLSDD